MESGAVEVGPEEEDGYADQSAAGFGARVVRVQSQEEEVALQEYRSDWSMGRNREAYHPERRDREGEGEAHEREYRPWQAV